MDRATALSKIRKILGPKFNYRVDPTAPNAEERAELRGEYTRMNEKVSELENRLNARRRELLEDEKYQDLKKAHDAARKLRDKTRGNLHASKFSVGITQGPFNFIKAEGDSWEDLIAKLKGNKKLATIGEAKVADTTDIPNSEIFGGP